MCELFIIREHVFEDGYQKYTSYTAECTECHDIFPLLGDDKDSLCFYRNATPFALIREGQTHIDSRCELPRVSSGSLVPESFDPNLS